MIHLIHDFRDTLPHSRTCPIEQQAITLPRL